MSTRIMTECWLRKTPPTAKQVLIALAWLMDDEGFCEPTIAELSSMTCASDRAVQEALSHLEQQEIISRQMRSCRSSVFIYIADRGPAR